MGRSICEAVNDLIETHIKLWDIVNMLNSDSDEILVKATRMIMNIIDGVATLLRKLTN